MKKSIQNAFSLVEVALALGVISFAIIGLLGLMTASQQTARESIDRTDGSLLFQKVVNQLKLKPYDKEQLAVLENPEVFPLPSLKTSAAASAYEPFLVDERYYYVGTPDDPDARAMASKVVRVIVLDSADLGIEGMTAPPMAMAGLLALVRVEISSPAAGYDPVKMEAPNKQVFETEITPLEQ